MDYHIYKKAKKRVRDKRKFYSHFVTWGVMSFFFIMLNLFTSDFFWAIFPILGWGIGLAFHGIKVFSSSYGEDWEEREIKREMERIRKNSYWKSRFEEDAGENQLNLKSIKQFRKEWNDSDFV